MTKEEVLQMQEEIQEISGVNVRKCMHCGKCTATCPCYDEMEYHPDQFVAMVERGELEPLLASKSLYLCLSCFACVERCPRQVEPGKLVEAVRQMVIREQGMDHLKSENVPGKIDDKLPQQALAAAFRKYRK